MPSLVRITSVFFKCRKRIFSMPLLCSLYVNIFVSNWIELGFVVLEGKRKSSIFFHNMACIQLRWARFGNKHRWLEKMSIKYLRYLLFSSLRKRHSLSFEYILTPLTLRCFDLSALLAKWWRRRRSYHTFICYNLKLEKGLEPSVDQMRIIFTYEWLFVK